MLSPSSWGKCGLHSERGSRPNSLLLCAQVSLPRQGENSPQLPLATPYEAGAPCRRLEPCPSGGGSVAQLHCKITFFAGVMTAACTVSPRGHSITDVVESPVPRCGGGGLTAVVVWGMVSRREGGLPLVRVGGTSPWQPGRWLPI